MTPGNVEKMVNENAIALIDCENLTAGPQRQIASLWSGFGRIELFGRLGLVDPWRGLLLVERETIIADDAPSQAADQEIAARVDALIAAPKPPSRVEIASNDKGFDADIRRLLAAGIAARRQGDLSPAEALRFLVAEQAVDGWASAGGVGDHLLRRFGLRLRGRLDHLAKAAAVEIRRTPSGVMLGLRS